MSSTPGAAAVLVKASGHVYAERNGTRISLAEGDGVQSSDILITDASSTAEVRFADGATATLSPGTTLELKNFAFGEGQEPSFVLNLVEGTMRSISGEVVKQNPDAFKIVTPRATVGIRGTELFNSVQGSDEVHAVLHIGKGHIVLVTGADGQNITLDSALQTVSMNDATSGKMVMQTFSPQEMQDLIQQLAPSQLQKSLPGADGPAGSDGPDASDGQSGEAQPGAEGQPAQAAGGTISTVVLVVEASTSAGSGGAEQALTQTGSSTLITIVETLQGGLADAGFTVESVVAGENPGEFKPLVPPSGGFVPPVGPDTAPEPEPSGVSYVINADQLGDWVGSHLADHGPDVPLLLTVNGGVLGVDNVAMNGQSLDSGVMGSDMVVINGNITSTGAGNGVLSGDVMNAGPGPFGSDTPPSLTFGSDNIVVNGSLLEGGFIYGDAKNLDGNGLSNVILGSDNITVTGNVERNAAIYGDTETPDNLGPLTGGNDVISVGGTLAGQIYGGYGNDTITVRGNVTGLDAKIDGGAGDDTIFINGSMLLNGSIMDTDGNNSITVKGDVKGGDTTLITGGAGNDTVHIFGSFSGNDGGALLGCGIELGEGNNRLSVDNTATALNFSSGAGNDSVTIGTLNGSGNANHNINLGAGKDTMTIGVMNGGRVIGGEGEDTLNIGIGNSSSSDPIRIYLGSVATPDDAAADRLTLKYGDFSGNSNVQVHGLGADDVVDLGHSGLTGTVDIDGHNQLTITFTVGGNSHLICLNVNATPATALAVFNQLVADGQVTGFGTVN